MANELREGVTLPPGESLPVEELQRRAASLEEERDRLREALRVSEERWRSLVAKAPAVVTLFDPAGNVLSVNRTATGRPRDEVTGTSVFDHIPPAFEPEARRVFAEIVATGRPRRHDLMLEAPDGREIWLENHVAPILEDGRVTSLISVSVDVTERKQMQSALQESEARFRDIVGSMGEWVFETDTDGRLTYCSPQVAQVLGYTAMEMLGKHPLETAAPEDRERQRKQLARQKESPGPIRGVEAWHVRKDGTRALITVNGGPISDAHGTLTGFRGVSTDATEKYRAETRLQQAQKLESLGILAGGIAHDFNNLLTAVLGNADLALEELPPAAAARDSVEQIQKAALHAAELTRQMLAYAGRGRLNVESVSVAGIVRDMAQLLGASVSKRHALRLGLEDGLPLIEADPAQVRQIVMNLVINASEAAGEQEGLISLRAAALGPGEDVAADAAVGDIGAGRHVLIEVTDSGMGMDAATLARIFDPFFSTKFAGRGLGLAAVLGIVRRHHGALRVASRPGAGSTFSVLLPVREGLAATPQAPGTAPANSWRGDGTVLLVDDEEPVRGVAERMLRAMGFAVLVAADGVEALERLDAGGAGVCAVLLDLTMPRMDGEQALRGIRERFPSLPVVLCSGFDVQEREGDFADLSVNGFLRKPYRLAELEQALRRALGA